LTGKLDGSKENKRVSNCFKCGWRTPWDNNPEGCILGIKDKDEILKNGYDNCKCDRYVMDLLLRRHITNIVEWSNSNAFDLDANA